LERDHVTLPRVERAEEVGEADAVVSRLPREHQPLQLAPRVVGVVDDQLVAVGGRREVAEAGARPQVILLAPHAL